MNEDFAQRVETAYESLPKGGAPSVAVVLGSGLSGVADGLGMEAVPFWAISGFPETTVAGHAGTLFLSGRAAVMAGRFHYYEGHSMDDVVLPIFLLARMGVKRLVLTNAAGGVNQSYAPGDLVLIKDHLNLMGTNPFIGPNPARAGAQGASPRGARKKAEPGEPMGPRFFDLSAAWSPALREIGQACAKNVLGRSLSEGVYAAMSGPSYETPAEIRMLRTLGADLVGMSTVPEALAARYLGMELLGISCVTNMAAGILDGPLDHAEVVETGKRVESSVRDLSRALMERLSRE